MYKLQNATRYFFLIHPGGPFFVRKNAGFWTLPKGIVEQNESLEKAAEREFLEETGIVPSPPYHPLGSVKLSSGKIIHAWAFEGEWDSVTGINCNIFDMEWPPHSGRFIKVPEADKGAWMTIDEARKMITKSQLPFLERLLVVLSERGQMGY